jgi:hypothetical protein
VPMPGITRTCEHRSSCRYRRSALRTIADYAPGMRKPIRRDGDRKSKTTSVPKSGDVAVESVLPPKKPPAPSVRHRLKRSRKAKLLK